MNDNFENANKFSYYYDIKCMSKNGLVERSWAWRKTGF